jgi:hypothetical protein
MSGDIKAVFDSNLIATQAGTVQVFHFDMTSREFIGTEEIFILVLACLHFHALKNHRYKVNIRLRSF